MDSQKRTDYISWDEYFMGIALLSAKRSKDPNTQVGACIVSKDNRILCCGYNGAPNGFDDDLLRFVITYADIVITPALESNTELFGLQTFGRILNDLQTKKTKNIFSCVLLNRIHPNTTNFDVIKSICDSDEKLVLMDSVIRDRSVYRKAFNAGKTIYETTSSIGKSEFNNLKKEIIKRLANEIVNG